MSLSSCCPKVKRQQKQKSFSKDKQGRLSKEGLEWAMEQPKKVVCVCGKGTFMNFYKVGGLP